MLQTNIYILTHYTVIISILTNNQLIKGLKTLVLTVVSKKFKMTTYIIHEMVYIIDKDMNILQVPYHWHKYWFRVSGLKLPWRLNGRTPSLNELFYMAAAWTNKNAAKIKKRVSSSKKNQQNKNQPYPSNTVAKIPIIIF